MKESNIVIIGAGISGLSLAYYLKKAGLKVTVLEKESIPGGKIKTLRKEGFRCECGPNTVLFQEATLKNLIRDLGLSSEMVFANKTIGKKRFIYSDRGLNKLPSSPFSLISTDLIDRKGKFNLLKDAFGKRSLSDKNTSVFEFFRAKLSEKFCDNILEPFVTGIYAGNIRKMSFRYAFPKLYEADQNYGSLIRGMMKMRKNASSNEGMFSFNDGLSRITDKLAELLHDELILESDVLEIKKEDSGYSLEYLKDGKSNRLEAKSIIDTRPLSETERSLSLKDYFPKPDYVAVEAIHLGFKEEDVRQIPEGFGVLSTRNSSRKFLGVIFSSDIFPSTAKPGYKLYTILVGGSRSPEFLGKTNAVINDFKQAFEIKAEAHFMHNYKWARAIPQYNIGHDQLIKSIDEFHESFPDFYLLGNYYQGVSIGDRIKSSVRLAEKITGRD